MNEIGAYEAKTQLPKLLSQVEQGAEYVITRRGVPVARLVPARLPDQRRIVGAIARIKAARSGARLGNLTTRKIREEGRR